MRNLKKLLALVLAMVMAFSLMLSASAVDYKDYQDKDNITEEFKEAVQVLTGLKVFQGDEGGFRPGDTITRAEVAAIVYRIATGDVDGNQVKIYADYGNFTDVDRNEWYAGYVGYCANAGYIKGTTPTTFEPNAPVTGWQALAMILRVVGYDKNGEFTGPTWQVNVASLSKDLGITNNVKNANFDTTLGYNGRRDVVADLLFQTAVKVPTVTYTAALGYNDRIAISETRKNATLGQKTFGLFCEGEWKEVDKWGRPGYYWVKGGSHAYTQTQVTNSSSWNYLYQYDDQWMPVYSDKVVTDPNDKGYNVVATIMPKATQTYTTTVRECDVAHDLDFDGDQIFKLHVNAKTAVTDKYTVRATDTVTRVGGQGRSTEFWYGVKSDFAGKLGNWTVMVDTYLAKVVKVTPVTKDAAGHIINKAELHLDVWDNGGAATYNSADGTRGTDAGSPNDWSSHVATKKTDWEYTVGQYVLIQGYTDKNTPADLDHVTAGATQQADIEKTAFETNMLVARNAANTKENDDKIDVLHAVEPKLAKQTTTYWNNGKHQVDGKDENDQMTLFMDYAGTKTGTTFAWYFDDLGNIIGIGPVPNTVNYGVITSIYSAFNQGDTNTDGTAKAIAHVKYANNEEADIVIDKFFVSGQSNAAPNAGGHGIKAAGTKMDDDETTSGDYNTVELLPVYDYNTANGSTMMGTEISPYTGTANMGAYLNVAPVASINTRVENAYIKTGAASHNGYFGIIKGNLFKFVASVDGEMTAIEVGGTQGSNSVRYAGHNAAASSATVGKNKIMKNLAYVTIDGADAQAAIWLDNDTKIMINDNNADLAKQTVTCYDGVTALPGNVTIAESTEIDWADTDNDGRADYLYVYGKVDGSITYGLFYYNGGAAQWDGVNSKGTLAGWLNGDATTLEFNDQVEFELVKNSQSYNGHLFAVQMFNGVVDKLMAKSGISVAAGPHEEYILAKTGAYRTAAVLNNGTPTVPATNGLALDTTTTLTAATGVDKTSAAAANVDFVCGVTGGNSYTSKSEAVYYNDVNASKDASGNFVVTDASESVVKYNADMQWIEVYLTTSAVDGTIDGTNAKSYKITPNTKIIGLGMGVATGTPVLEYLNHSVKNDVTIVYENTSNNINAIVAIYVATDPNVTPSDAFNPVNYTPSGVNNLGDFALGYTQATLTTYLNGLAPNQVVFSPKRAADFTGQPDTDAWRQLYFPYVTKTAAAQAISMTITDANGAIVHLETVAGVTDARGHCFTINWTVNSVVPAVAYQQILGPGTYYFTLTGSTDGVLSTGSFSIVAK